MTRILFDVTHTLDSEHTTGVQRVVRRMALWARHWPNTTLIRFDREYGGFIPLTDEAIESLVDDKNSSTVRLSSGDTTLRALARSIPGARDCVDSIRRLRTLSKLKTAVHQVDLRDAIYFTGEVFGEADRTAALHWWLNKGQTRVALVVHDLIPHFHPHWSIFSRRHFQNYLAVLRRASVLMPVSEHTKKQLSLWMIEKKISPPRLAVVRPGFDPPGGAASEPRRATGLGRFFISVGTIEVRKNQLRVLDALTALGNSECPFSFVFVGREADGGEFRKRLQMVNGKRCNILWWNDADDSELEWLYHHAEATVYPSLAEGFGLPVIESLTRGTPCITAAGGATGEIADDLGGCLTVNPTDSGTIQQALELFLKNPELRGELMSTFRREKLKSWQGYATKVHDILLDD